MKIFLLKFLLVFFSLSSLLTGSLIYLIYRPINLKFFSWLKLLGFEESIIQLRTIFKNTQPCDFVIYNLPNGLWVISSTIFLLIIWENNYNKEFRFYLSLLLLMVILPELFQYFNIISGTFDITDLVVNFFGLVIPIIFIFILSKKRKDNLFP